MSADPRDQEDDAPKYEIRPAKRGNAKPVVGLYSVSGGGKTKSALLLARGCVGPQGRIGMIETEEGRGEAYADPAEEPEIGGYEVIPMRDNFSPRSYGQAIDVANKSKLDALIIDSASHEWFGIGGVLDMASKNEEAGKKGLLIWQKPKIDHQMHFLNRILQSPIPLVILNMRAKYPMVGQGAAMKRSTVLEPIQSDDILYEMFVHGWIDRENHNFHVGNSPSASLRAIFAEDKPITLDTGRALAAWMKGRTAVQADPKATSGKGVEMRDGATNAAIELIDAFGEARPYARWGLWLNAFKEALASNLTPAQAQALWEHNEATYMRGHATTAPDSAPRKAFDEVGALALQKRTPAGEQL